MLPWTLLNAPLGIQVFSGRGWTGTIRAANHCSVAPRSHWPLSKNTRRYCGLERTPLPRSHASRTEGGRQRSLTEASRSFLSLLHTTRDLTHDGPPMLTDRPATARPNVYGRPRLWTPPSMDAPVDASFSSLTFSAPHLMSTSRRCALRRRLTRPESGRHREYRRAVQGCCFGQQQRSGGTPVYRSDHVRASTRRPNVTLGVNEQS